MLGLQLVPKIYEFKTFKEFHDEFNVTEKDLLVTNRWIYEPYVKPLNLKMNLIFQEDYGQGEPSDEMIDKMTAVAKDFEYERIIAFGGGTIIDICKIMALDVPEKSVDLFTGDVAPVKKKELVIIPTTCGTGSEVTNVSIAELKSLNTKKGIAVPETFADHAVLIPESLKGLPYRFFITSSVDALVHAFESFLSPKATPFTEMYSEAAMKIIMSRYAEVIKHGEDERQKYLDEFLLASNFAGIAFGNAGCGAVHAISYSIGGAFHVPHGEANYQFFTEVFNMYYRKAPDGKIKRLTKIISEILGCPDDENVFNKLNEFLDQLIATKPLKEYGMVEAQIDEFTDMTLANQQRLLANNYVELSRADIREIFANLY